ncbi:MAG TPA: class I SAM-dependent methyltransferase [Gemmataceae bacterium]|nr:class I SAM-dependent methyltransferase [Gemmataceae bacterium]
MSDESDKLAKRYYLDFAAAFVRGKMTNAPDLPPAEIVRLGLKAGLRLHKFKRTSELPRVRKVLGMLRGLAPCDLLDIGSGRGVFLWPLLDAFPWLTVTALDRHARRIEDIHAVRRGGIARLTTLVGDGCRLPFADKSVDVVTILEVLEHLPQPEQAAAEAVRVARRGIIVSVPSKKDDNPEHIYLFTRDSLHALLRTAGARRVHFDGVLNHLLALATV